jgi:hypothetical protein
MPNFAPWYRRNEYSLMREILEDGETLPPNFDEWEANAENERETARLIPVFIEPEEFFSFCKEKKISPNTTTAAEFARSRGLARYSLGQ